MKRGEAGDRADEEVADKEKLEYDAGERVCETMTEADNRRSSQRPSVVFWCVG